MPWFEFHQNNSGGYHTGPAISVIVEAPNADTANAIVQLHDVYFDGCADGRDCDCCGDRWSTLWREDGDAVPSHHGNAIGSDADKSGIAWGRREGFADFLIVHADGKTELLDDSGAPFIAVSA